MRYSIIHSDEAYIKVLEAFYNKHYKDQIDIVFNKDEDNRILICETRINEACMVFSNRNQVMTKEVNQYQSGKDLMVFLMSINHEDLKGASKFKTYGFCNMASRSGSTSLSLNLADQLQQKGKTFWLSLEHLPSAMFYLERKSGLSLSDVIFYMENDIKILREKLSHDKDGFFWLDACENISDVSYINDEKLKALFEILDDLSYSNVIVDFGNNLRLMLESNTDKKIGCILYEMNHFYRLSSLNIAKDMIMVINKRRENLYLNESMIKYLPNYTYIDYEHDLEGDRKWSSKNLQQKLLKALNQT